MAPKKIGILGGMGPAASAHFYQKIVFMAQKKYNAVQDTEYPCIILYSLCLEGFDETGIINPSKVLEQLLHGVSVLETAGAECIVIPCNTVHCFIDEMRKNSNIPILSIIEETAQKINKEEVQKVLVLASETTLSLGLYEHKLKEKGIHSFFPDAVDYFPITALIAEVMSGTITMNTKTAVLSLIKKLDKTSTMPVILGCTELPLAITQKDISQPVYDTLDILAEAVLSFAYGKI